MLRKRLGKRPIGSVAAVVLAIGFGGTLLYLPGTASASLTRASSSRAAVSHKAAKLYSLAFVNPASANSYQIAYQCGIVEYAKSEGFNLTSVADNSTFTVEAQIPLLQAAAAKSPRLDHPTSPRRFTPTLKQSGRIKVGFMNTRSGTIVATGTSSRAARQAGRRWQVFRQGDRWKR